MNTAFFGWEANGIENSQVQSVSQITDAITIIGYQFSLSAGTMSLPLYGTIGAAPYTIIAWYALITPSVPNGWAGGATVAPMTFKAIGGSKPGSFASSPPQAGFMAVSNIELWVASAVNKELIMPPGSLALPVPAGSCIVTQAAHSGYAANLSCSGLLFYV